MAGSLHRQVGPAPLLLRWAVVAGFGVAWQLAALWIASPFLPPITDVLARARELWLSGPPATLFLSSELTTDLLPSLARLGAGWGLAVVAGVGLGVVLGLSGRLAAYVEPLVHFLRAVPPPALVPLLVVVLGIGDGMKVALIAFGVVWVILLGTLDGVRSVDGVQLETARAFGIGRRRQVTGIVLPAAMPRVLAALRVSLAIGLILVVLSEMVAVGDGIGARILTAQRGFRLVDMWAGILLLGLLGYGLNAALSAVEARVLAWHRGAHEEAV